MRRNVRQCGATCDIAAQPQPMSFNTRREYVETIMSDLALQVKDFLLECTGDGSDPEDERKEGEGGRHLADTEQEIADFFRTSSESNASSSSSCSSNANGRGDEPGGDSVEHGRVGDMEERSSQGRRRRRRPSLPTDLLSLPTADLR